MPGANIGIDLGTASVKYFMDGKGVVLSQDMVTASDAKSGKTITVGTNAYHMIGRTPDSITVHRPVREGIVADFTATQDLLRYDLQKICGNQIFKPNLVLCVPTDVTGLEKRTLLDIATAAGAAKACLIEKPLACALGAGVDPKNASATMIVDVGAGCTEIALISMSNVAVSQCIHTAGNAFDEAIQRYVRRERAITIGDLSAEQIKKKIGCAYLRDAEIAILVKGKSYVSGLPLLFEINTTEVFLALREHLEKIVEGIRSVLSQSTPELCADVSDNGILLAGGSALLPGLDRYIERKIGIKTSIANDPINCVARGIGFSLKHPEILTGNGYFFKSRQDLQ